MPSRAAIEEQPADDVRREAAQPKQGELRPSKTPPSEESVNDSDEEMEEVSKETRPRDNAEKLADILEVAILYSLWRLAL